jgi:hypothetical protein
MAQGVIRATSLAMGLAMPSASRAGGRRARAYVEEPNQLACWPTKGWVSDRAMGPLFCPKAALGFSAF